MDFSCLDNLPTLDDEPKYHKNLPYLMLQIVSGKSGSGKTYLVMKELLAPGFLDDKELYVLSPNINTKEYQFLKHGFEYNINKEVLLEFFPQLKIFRLNRLEDSMKVIGDNTNPSLKQNDIKNCIYFKERRFPIIKEMNADLPKLFIFDDLSGDREFQETIRNFYCKRSTK